MRPLAGALTALCLLLLVRPGPAGLPVLQRLPGLRRRRGCGWRRHVFRAGCECREFPLRDADSDTADEAGQIPGHPSRYEIEQHDNHHHFVCRRCGAIRDVECTVGAAPCMEPQLP
ncbi:transcriptional repressor [Streptomyces sp. NPDC060064]|uniref:transcriptional repressor n=1 Tax=Streptomyces sp. NPDC060064 TaxID=3347049 RepID=UPI003689497D